MYEFAALPPEINSGRMYTGPGSGPMLAAAAAWDGLATELYSAAQQYGSVIAELTDGLWSGPSATAMQTAADPQLAWLSSTAGQAERAATLTRAAVSAYETAFAMTVPPPVIAANRALLMALIATNFLGQNTPAIAATEAHYAEMWAQDAAAMHGYAAASAVHATLMPFTAPPQGTNPGAQEAQAAAVTQLGTTTAANAQTLLSLGPQVLSAASQALHALAATPGSFAALLETVSQLGVPPIVGQLGTTFNPILGYPLLATIIASISLSEIVLGGGLGWPAGAVASPFAAAGAAASVVGYSAGGAPVSAGVGNAIQVGKLSKLSVPQSWAEKAPEVHLAADEQPSSGSDAVTGDERLAGLGGMPGLLGATPLLAMGNQEKRDKNSEEPEESSSAKQRLPRYWR